ncbi:hypothetical protein AB0395_47120 [Streptosporangium sp. NPDC051023]|uniref:hypothetical protein n=1 Tax=Streptosporangium sp. NPDC051023 TaxID=3155410 RepID=UPI00344F1C59
MSDLIVEAPIEHPACAEVARLVAAEYAAHAAHMRQDDTLGLATELLRARPADDSERARGIREGLEIAIKVAFIRAGLPLPAEVTR